MMFTTVYCLGLLFLFKAMTSDSFSTDCGEPGLCHDMLIDQQACASLDNCILQGDSKYVINYLVFTALKVILTKMLFWYTKTVTKYPIAYLIDYQHSQGEVLPMLPGYHSTVTYKAAQPSTTAGTWTAPPMTL